MFSHKTVLLFIFLFQLYFSFSIKAQITEQWAYFYNGQNNGGAAGYAITIDVNGYIYTTGEAYDTNGTGIFALKCNLQGDTIWSRFFPGPHNSYTISQQLVDMNSNVYILCYNQDYITGKDLVTLKYDSSGVFQWSATYNGPDSLDDIPRAIAVDDSGNVYVTGHSETSLLNNPTDIVTIKYNSSGLQQWVKIYDDAWNKDDYAGLVAVDDSGNVYISGHQGAPWLNNMGFITIKYNSAGLEKWSSIYSDASGGYNLQNIPGILQLDSSGNVYVCGFFDYSTGQELLTIKYNYIGDTIWTARGNSTANNMISVFSQIDMIRDSDGNIHIAAVKNTYGLVEILSIEYDYAGNELWKMKYITNEFSTDGNIYDIKQDINYNVYITGVNFIKPNNPDDSYVVTMKINSNGSKEWDATFDPGYGYDLGFTLALDNAGDVYVTGWSFSTDWTTISAPIVKYCGRCNSIIRGNIFIDSNTDCIKDSSEVGFKKLLVQATPGPYYATTDSNGYYAILVPQDTFTVKEIINSYWNIICPVSGDYSVTLVDSGEVSFNNNFANEIAIYCPFMTVDISTWALRPCSTSVYTVQYCNNGTIDADSVYIDISFDNDITPMSSTLPWNSQTGNIYTFNIGMVAAQQCGNFYITANVSCSAVLGSTHCIEAHIYPDSICTPVDTTWDKSSISVEGNCVNDSLACFTIYNKNNDMQGLSQYRIYENNVLVDTGYFQLSAGDSIVICRPANGNTIRLEADQRPGHPGNSHPQAHIELCGGLPPAVMGMITQVPEDDADEFIETDCRQITASVDPNEKQVKPAGIVVNHFIDSLDILEYQINFQNTGTDTAFGIVVRDTLTEYLDITTVQSGAGSHPYSFRIYGQGILEWKFNNILLPDSNTNEPLSHGFVRFKAKQQLGNNIGSVIENRAAIYFDYNAPVITNTVFNTIWKEEINPSISKVYEENTNILIFPNPANDVITIIKPANTKNATLSISDITGRNIITIPVNLTVGTINIKEFQEGVYLMKFHSGDETVVYKLVKF